LETLLGDPSKAKQKSGWPPRIIHAELVQESLQADCQSEKRESLPTQTGYQADYFNK